MVTMDNGFGKMIYNGTILDLNKLDDIQIGQILKELQDDQSLKKNKINKILDKMCEEM